MNNNIKAEIIAHSKRAETGEEIDNEKPEDKDYYVYKTTNIINGKFYIGKRHYRKKDEKWYLGSGIYLNRAIKKYGRENFKKEIIEWCSSSEEVNNKERFWIAKLDALNPKIAYNIASGGDGGFLGEEVSKRVGMKLKGRKLPKEVCEKMSKAMKGKKKSEEQIEKIRKALTGRKRTEKEIENIRKAALKLYEEGFESPIQISIYQYDIKTGDFINSYKSCSEASRMTGFDRKAINHACLGITKKSNKFIWSIAKFKNYYNRFSTIKAELICHSKRRNTGEEIITYKLTYPRCIHSELMTYHMMSVNSASSRAIPVDKLIGVIEETPFYPCYLQLQHKGMQGNQYADYKKEQRSFKYWNEALHNSVRIAKELSKDVTKQLVNRLLEPYQYHCCLMTGTRESFEHLFDQRCPVYEVPYYINDPVEEGEKLQRTLGGCSKKEIMKSIRENKLDSEVFSWNELDWLQCNSGQAEIHFMDLAEKMYDALNESTPVMMEEDEWHIPFSDRPEFTPDMSLKDKIMLSCAMTARVSYTTIADNETLTLEKAKSIYTKCVQSGHNSVVSHCAKCMTDDERNTWIKGELKQVAFSEFDSETFLEAPEEAKGFSKNLRGFIPLRQYVEDGVELSKFK